MAVLLEDALPVVKHNGINSAKDVVLSGTTCSLPSTTTIGGSSVSALGSITSTGANALVVGRQGATNPAFNVNASSATGVTGIDITANIAASGVAVAATSSGTNESMTIDAKGSGTITLNGTATGGVTLGRATTVTTGDVTLTSGSIVVTAINKGISFTATGTSGGVLTNLYNDASTTLAGTQRDIKILIGTVPYYFTVYPTKS